MHTDKHRFLGILAQPNRSPEGAADINPVLVRQFLRRENVPKNNSTVKGWRKFYLAAARFGRRFQTKPKWWSSAKTDDG
jgi:hypothetical protein